MRSAVKKVVPFLGPKEEVEVREELQRMVLSSTYNTSSSYTPSSLAYPDGQMPFIDKHMKYLHANPKLDGWMYLANLRLRTRINR